MNIISEFFDPIPLAAMLAVVFLIVLIMVIARIFRMPESFAGRQKVRGNIRYMMFMDKLASSAEGEASDKGAEASVDTPEVGQGAEAAPGDAP